MVRYALTIALNPSTYVKIGPSRKRYDEYSIETQKALLDTLLSSFEDSKIIVEEYVFELTKAGNYHIHATIDYELEQQLSEAIDSCYKKLDRKRPNERMVKRMFKTREVHDLKGWQSYINKNQDSPIKDSVNKETLVLPESVTTTQSVGPSVNAKHTERERSVTFDSGDEADSKDDFKMPTKKLF